MTLSTKKNPGEMLTGVPGEVAGVMLLADEEAVRVREEVKAGNYRTPAEVFTFFPLEGLMAISFLKYLHGRVNHEQVS